MQRLSRIHFWETLSHLVPRTPHWRQTHRRQLLPVQQIPRTLPAKTRSRIRLPSRPLDRPSILRKLRSQVILPQRYRTPPWRTLLPSAMDRSGRSRRPCQQQACPLPSRSRNPPLHRSCRSRTRCSTRRRSLPPMTRRPRHICRRTSPQLKCMLESELARSETSRFIPWSTRVR